MNDMPRLLPCLLALTPHVAAQCQFQTATVQTYGAGCSAVFGFFPTLQVTLDAASCALQIAVAADNGCCNTFLQATVLALGTQAIAVPVPQLDPACVLYTSTDLMLMQVGIVPGVFTLPIPPGLPPLTLSAQGAGLYYTTITFPLAVALQFSLTSGYLISLP